MRIFAFRTLLVLSILVCGARADYLDHPDARALIDELVREEGLQRIQLERIMAEARFQQAIVDAMNRPAERVLSWADYRRIFMGENRIAGGVDFWRSNATVLAEAEREFGVPAAIIVAIIGVETLYGRITGNYRVIDALATLAFDYPARSPFFRSELKHFLVFTAQQQRDPLEFKGSYAGAMGYAQFMPSSYRNYARGYGGGDFPDLWENQADAIWSVGNYLAAHGWRRDDPVTRQLSSVPRVDSAMINSGLRTDTSVGRLRALGVDLPADLDDRLDTRIMMLEGDERQEYWLGMHNFYVITRYNISQLYAMAVYQLSRAIEERYQDIGG